MKKSKEYEEIKKILQCVSEVQLSYSRKTEIESKRMVSSSDIYELSRKEYDEGVIDYREQVWLILLNNRANVLGYFKLSEGGIDSAFVDVRLCFQAALLTNATSIVLVHNHPTGSLTPSRQDDELTNSIKEAGKIMKVRLLDHVIVTSDNGYYSYADYGKL